MRLFAVSTQILWSYHLSHLIGYWLSSKHKESQVKVAFDNSSYFDNALLFAVLFSDQCRRAVYFIKIWGQFSSEANSHRPRFYRAIYFHLVHVVLVQLFSCVWRDGSWIIFSFQFSHHSTWREHSAVCKLSDFHKAAFSMTGRRLGLCRKWAIGERKVRLRTPSGRLGE